MKKYLYLFLLVCISSCSKSQVDITTYQNDDLQQLKIEINGDYITLKQAENVAKLFNLQNRTKGYDSDNIENSFTIENEYYDSQIHVVNFNKNDGYVIVSSSTKYAPILAYCETGYFDSNYKNTPVEIWLNEQLYNIHCSNKESSNNYSQEWNSYKRQPLNNMLTKSESLNSFRDEWVSMWESQGYICHPLYEKPDDLPDDIYNNFCQSAEGIANPDYDYMINSIILESNTTRITLNTGNFLTSTWNCSGDFSLNTYEDFSSDAVAIGQILKYHNWIYNNSNFIDFDWDEIHDNYATYETKQLLAYIDSNISTHNINSIKNFFNNNGYPNARIISHNSVTTRDNLLSRKPIFMIGGENNSQHSWVCSGYQSMSRSKEYFLYVISVVPPLQFEYTGLSHYVSSSSGAYYYMNWGWGGQYNGWFFNTNVNPGNNNYINYRKDIVDIFPSI